MVLEPYPHGLGYTVHIRQTDRRNVARTRVRSDPRLDYEQPHAKARRRHSTLDKRTAPDEHGPVATNPYISVHGPKQHPLIHTVVGIGAAGGLFAASGRAGRGR